jgi:hypothetical protein
MAELIYSAITSLDGYVADEDGNFDWAEPDEEVHTFVKRPRAADRHLPLRAPAVRGDGRLGDDQPRRPAILHSGLRGDLASGRQDRLFRDAGGGIERQHADRARLRPSRGSANESGGGT